MENLIEYIKNAKKKTFVKVYVKGESLPDSQDVGVFGNVLIGELNDVLKYLND